MKEFGGKEENYAKAEPDSDNQIATVGTVEFSKHQLQTHPHTGSENG